MKEESHSQKRTDIQKGEISSEDLTGKPPQRIRRLHLSQKQITWITVWVIQLLILSLVLVLSSR